MLINLLVFKGKTENPYVQIIIVCGICIAGIYDTYDTQPRF